MTKKDLTLADKIALLDKMKCQLPNTSQRQFATITGVPKATIGRIIQHEAQLRKEWAK